MLQEDSDKYGARLAAVAGTRLLFNTIGELEEFLGCHAIRTNGIRRCFPTAPRLRGAYRDCRVEVELQTDGQFDLDWLMRRYEGAWEFYKSHFARRKHPEVIARRLLESYYALLAGGQPGGRYRALAEEMQRADVDVALLTLLLIRAIPGCDSRSGDVADMEAHYEAAMQFLQDFTRGCGLFDVLPVIKLALEEERRTRLMLICHTIRILDTYADFLNPVSLGRANAAIKEKCAPLDIAGFWADEDDASTFWEIEETLNDGVYFATRYSREGRGLLSLTRYTLQLLRSHQGRLTAYMLHPVAMKHKLQGHPYGDEDNAWYLCDNPEPARPEQLTLVRTMQSAHWPYTIALRRVATPEQSERYAYEVQSSVKIDPYEKCRYTFTPSLYAITQTAAYVVDEQEDCLYKLPRYTEHQFEDLTFDNNVGILEMDGTRYLAIDERLLYIPLTPRQLKRYGIERTDGIE